MHKIYIIFSGKLSKVQISHTHINMWNIDQMITFVFRELEITRKHGQQKTVQILLFLAMDFKLKIISFSSIECQIYFYLKFWDTYLSWYSVQIDLAYLLLCCGAHIHKFYLTSLFKYSNLLRLYFFIKSTDWLTPPCFLQQNVSGSFFLLYFYFILLF